jgi:hypothetical protein
MTATKLDSRVAAIRAPSFNQHGTFGAAVQNPIIKTEGVRIHVREKEFNSILRISNVELITMNRQTMDVRKENLNAIR